MHRALEARHVPGRQLAVFGRRRLDGLHRVFTGGEIDALRDVARGEGNLLPPIKEALRAGGSIGEVCNAMRDVFGEYRGGAFF